MNANAKDRVFAEDEQALQMKRWQERDAERQREAIAAARQIRDQLDKTLARNTAKDEREFDAIWWGSVRIYLVQRIVEDAPLDMKAMRRAIADGVQDVVDELQAQRAMTTPSS